MLSVSVLIRYGTSPVRLYHNVPYGTVSYSFYSNFTTKSVTFATTAPELEYLICNCTHEICLFKIYFVIADSWSMWRWGVAFAFLLLPLK